MTYNPKLTAFIEEHKDMTLVGFAWAAFWRLYLALLGAVFAIAFTSALFD